MARTVRSEQLQRFLDIQPLYECESRRSPRTIEKSRSGIPLSIILRRELSIGTLSKASFSLPPLNRRQQSRKQWLPMDCRLLYRTYLPLKRSIDRSIDRLSLILWFPCILYAILLREHRSFSRLRPRQRVRAAVCLARLGTISLPYHLCCLVTHRGHFFIIMSRHNVVSSQPLFLHPRILLSLLALRNSNIIAIPIHRGKIYLCVKFPCLLQRH